MKSILFVDDETNILNGLRRMLHAKKNEWRMVFVSSGEKALTILQEQAFDVVVSDMRMPCMNGATLLTAIRVKYPRISRIALSGYSDTEMILDSIKATHLFISKPADYTTLSNAIERCLSIQAIIYNNDLCDFISGISTLPSVPEIYNELVRELNSNEACIDSVGDIIQRDIGMSVKLLQIVNSAFFGLAREIVSPTQAAAHLGLDIIKSLVLSIKVFEVIEDESTAKKSSRIFSRSQTIAQLATNIAKSLEFSKQECEQILLAGLLQDIGELVICRYFPRDLQAAFNEPTTLDLTQEIERERGIFGVSHEQIAVYLLHLWGIPLSVVECVAFHHGAQETINFEKLTLPDVLYLSNLIISQRHAKPLPTEIASNEAFQEFYKQWQPVN